MVTIRLNFQVPAVIEFFMSIPKYALKLTFTRHPMMPPFGKFDAFVAKEDDKNISTEGFPKYIAVTKDGQTTIFKVSPAGHSKGLLYIHPEVFPGMEDESDFVYRKVSARRFVIFKTFNDKKTRPMVWGVGLATFGLILDFCVAAGKIEGFPAKAVSPLTIVFLTWVSMVLKIIGLMITFFVGVRDGK